VPWILHSFRINAACNAFLAKRVVDDQMDAARKKEARRVKDIFVFY